MLQRIVHGRVIGNAHIVSSHEVIEATESCKLHSEEIKTRTKNIKA